MLSSLMEKRLKNLKEGRLIAVMEDGEAFLGKLKEFDKDTIVLTEVCEGPSSKIEWGTLGEKEDSSQEDYGFVDWVCVNLEEVYLRVDHISRIWPWEHVEEYREDEEGEKRTPVYTRTPAIDILSEGS
ncbi:MAG: hypothetical protein V5A66_02245 [Candidatus Thermoplasmatota archaeon]